MTSASSAPSIFIELSTSSLRYISVSRSEAGWTVHSAQRIVSESKSRLADALKQAAAAPAGGFVIVGASIWSSAIIVRRITMPLMTDKEIGGAITFEAEKHIPYPVNECVLDHFVVRKMQASRQMELMLIVAKKDLVNERRQILEEAGLGLNFIDIHPIALSNAYLATMPAMPGQAVALVHIGDTDRFTLTGSNFVNIIKDGNPQLVRDLGQDTNVGTDKLPQEAVDAMAEKVKASVEFYENSTEEEIADLYIAGQGGANESLCSTIAQSTEKKIKPWSALDKFKFDNKEAEELIRKNEKEFLVCLGLVARGLKL